LPWLIFPYRRKNTMDTMRVLYVIQSSQADIAARAEAVALEQSVELPRPAVSDSYVIRNIMGQVEKIEAAGDSLYQVTIQFPVEITGYEPAQFLNVLFGNTSLQGDVLLVDFELPASLLHAFSGPKFGMEGMRALVEAYARPLTATALKPMGLAPAQLADLCFIFAKAGIDFIKDDHGLATQTFAPFAERVRVCQEAIRAAYDETGHRSVYVPNLLGTPSVIAEEIAICREFGVRAVMFEPMLIGLPTFYELVSGSLDLPILSHPAFGGALRIAPELLFGKLFRLLGSDAVIYPNFGGRFTYSKEACATLAANLRQPFGDLKPAFPVPAGGMQVDRVAEMTSFYGQDTILLIGGSLYMAGDALLERSTAFVQNVGRMASE
jgi:ribulose-bisphosphate carboxylase large chain